jgi:CRISPR/Cas system-associated protein Cas10 (large subunit of type III CRISPR-Cas system)
METKITRSEANDYRYKCPVCGRLMHFLEEIDDMIAAYWCDLCKKVRPGSWKK